VYLDYLLVLYLLLSLSINCVILDGYTCGDALFPLRCVKLVGLTSHVCGICSLPIIALDEEVIGLFINVNSVLHYFIWLNEHVSGD
jgi:hypothetical protein